MNIAEVAPIGGYLVPETRAVGPHFQALGEVFNKPCQGPPGWLSSKGTKKGGLP